MIVVPAIDIRHGQVVRLRQGRSEEQTTYGHDPAEAARRWEAEGARRLHLVDLDAAIDALAPARGRRGGDRRGLDPGGDRRRAPLDGGRPPLPRRGGRAADLRDRGGDPPRGRGGGGRALARRGGGGHRRPGRQGHRGRVEGRHRAPGPGPRGAGQGLGCRARAVHRRLAATGPSTGPNLEAIAEMARGTGLRITAAGGVSTLDDLVRLRTLEELGVDEAISGKALYDECFTLAEAHAALAARRENADAGQAPRPLPRRGPRPRGEGREVRLDPRRRRPRGGGHPLRRRGRRRAGVPRHHRVLGRPSHRPRHGAAGGRRGLPALHRRGRGAHRRRRRGAPAGRGGQGRGEHRRGGQPCAPPGALPAVRLPGGGAGHRRPRHGPGRLGGLRPRGPDAHRHATRWSGPGRVSRTAPGRSSSRAWTGTARRTASTSP